jgi:cobalt-zinc-cadmium efflux system protein
VEHGKHNHAEDDGHDHGHDHGGGLGGHSHVSAANASKKRLAAVLALSTTMLVTEFVGAILTNSLALLADAAHMLTDVGGLAGALVAIWLASRPATSARTFGYLRLEILAAGANATMLFFVAGYILYEAWHRLSEPPEIASGLMLAVACAGMLANAISLYLLHDAQSHSLNMRGAYLEVMGDFIGASAVLVAAAVIASTGWTPADILASLAVGLLILPRTFTLLREAVNVLLEATPKGVDMDEVRKHILDAPGVIDCHDLHAWTITSGMNVVSAHVVLGPDADPALALQSLSDCLADDFDIAHSTFQLEGSDRRPLELHSHA